VARFSFTRFRGIAYRATSYDTPLWPSPNRRQGRWSHPDDGTIAQYCALDAAAPLAEFVRHEGIRDPAEAREIRMMIWQLRLAEGAVVDLSDPERSEGQGVSWDRLVADDWTGCRQIGREIQAAGGRGVIGPNAALPGSLSITVFGARSEISWEAEPRLAIQVPARDVVRGPPGKGLVRNVRHFGDEYPVGVRFTSVAHMLDEE
jgi:RES domain-containing protein